MDKVNFEKKYKELFSTNECFKKTYLVDRMKLYMRIVKLMKSLDIKSALDIGCAYGLLVEAAVANGIDCWGLDYPIEELKNYHSKLPLSSKNFIYGSVEDEKQEEMLSKKFEAVILLDTLRSLRDTKNITSFSPQYIIVKDACDNNKNRRKPIDSILSANLYGPNKLLEIFKNYEILFLYPSKFIFKLKKPSSVLIKMVNNLFPTYCAVLERK
ncbi:MAG: hypothetical protein N2445_00175 [Acidobacteria bacterium]|nr:hypothetical protein [Acidobacteriota bacterium]